MPLSRSDSLRERAIARRKQHDKIAKQSLEAALKAMEGGSRWRALNYVEEASRALAIADSWHHEIGEMEGSRR